MTLHGFRCSMVYPFLDKGLPTYGVCIYSNSCLTLTILSLKIVNISYEITISYSQIHSKFFSELNFLIELIYVCVSVYV